MDKTYFLKKTAIRQKDTNPLGTRVLLVGEGNKTNVYSILSCIVTMVRVASVALTSIKR